MLLAICKKHLDKTKCISHNVKCKYILCLEDMIFHFICINILVINREKYQVRPFIFFILIDGNVNHQ